MRRTSNRARNVAPKAGLHREIFATAARALLDMLRYKAAEAGVAYTVTRTVRSSQTCGTCGKRRKKALLLAA